MNWHQLVDDAASSTGHRVRTRRFFRDINAFNHDVIGINALLYDTTLALVLAGQDDDFVIFSNLGHDHSLQNFGRERHDFHEALGAQLARHRPKNTRTNRLQLGVQQYRGIAIELDQRSILATHALGGANDHRIVNLTFFDA